MCACGPTAPRHFARDKGMARTDVPTAGLYRIADVIVSEAATFSDMENRTAWADKPPEEGHAPHTPEVKSKLARKTTQSLGGGDFGRGLWRLGEYSRANAERRYVQLSAVSAQAKEDKHPCWRGPW